MTMSSTPPRPQEPHAVDRFAQKRAEQREALSRARRRRVSGASRDGTSNTLSPWAHIPLVSLLKEFGYSLVKTSATAFETAHAAHPASKSGRNMVIWPREGRALCRKCNRLYDAPAFIMEQQGVSFQAAADWLIARYGPPKGWRGCASTARAHGGRQAGDRAASLARRAPCAGAGAGSGPKKAYLTPREMPR